MRWITSRPPAAPFSNSWRARRCPPWRRSKRAPMVRELSISTRAQGLHEITSQVAHAVRDAKVDEGLCTLFVRHTSASLVIQENADPTAKQDRGRSLLQARCRRARRHAGAYQGGPETNVALH